MKLWNFVAAVQQPTNCKFEDEQNSTRTQSMGSALFCEQKLLFELFYLIISIDFSRTYAHMYHIYKNKFKNS